ncbi:hypothetical protein LCGC14_1159420 [marine sediment metagenome]|uniref:Fido domain-containing protein n=1 Tax=marine sediment metagenome TaxID=412755 RepID=A0A0F9MG71_9ZZZZ
MNKAKAPTFFGQVLVGPSKLRNFLTESNEIEGITRPVTDDEYCAAQVFLDLETLTVEDVCKLVDVFQPGAKLRDKLGMDVRVGKYYPPMGAPEMKGHLEHVLYMGLESRLGYGQYKTHLEFELLHPFTDGNGRSGRMIWLWQMNQRGQLDYALRLGFLHAWYYQSLSEGR